MANMKRPVYTDYGMNEEFEIEAPVWLWYAIMIEYCSANWNSPNLNYLLELIQEKLLNPAFLKEMQAHESMHSEAQRNFMRAVLTGERPENPFEELGEGDGL